MGDHQDQRHRSRPATTDRADLAQFLCSQAEAILACDFFTAGLLDGTQAHVLTVIEHATRRIRILGVTLHPTGAGPRSRPATSSWTSAIRRTGSSS